MNKDTCIAMEGNGCSCPACEQNNKAYDAIDDKNPDITAYDALIQDGFNDVEAKEQVEMFDDMGIFNEKELYCTK